MSDPWSRPVGDGRATGPPTTDGIIEIELDGPSAGSPNEGEVAAGDTGDAEPNWRKVVGLSSLGGVVLGSIIAAVLFAGGDDGTETPTSTTLDPIEAASRITTPPTLPPVEPTSPPTTGAIPGGAGGGPASEVPTGPTLPTYPEVADIAVAEGDFELDFAYLTDPVVVRSTVVLDSGDGPQGVSVVYDPATNRYRLADDTVEDAVFIVDIDTNTTFSLLPGAAEPDAWQAIDNDTLFGTDEFGLEEYLRALLLGPVRPETVGGRTRIRTALPLRRLEDGTIVRHYAAAIPADELPEWPFLFGGSLDGEGELEIEYDVYVTRDGVVRRTEGLVTSGGRTLLTRFDFDVGGRLSIELPDPALVVQPDGNPVGAGDAESARPRYPDAASASGELPPLEQVLRSSDAEAATIVTTTQIVGVAEASFRTERDPVGRLFQTIDDFDPQTRNWAQFDDVATGTGYTRTGLNDAPWETGSLGTEIEPIDPHFIDGLLTAAELAAGDLVGTRLVALAGNQVAVEYQLTLQGATVSDDSGILDFVDTTAPFTVYVYALVDAEPRRVHEMHVLTNRSEPVVWTQRFEYVQRDEFTPPGAARN